MGQGVYTTLASLVAEELSVTLEQIKVEHSPASDVYYNRAVLEEGIPFASTDMGKIAEGVREFIDVPAKLYGLQVTGGSSSVADAYHKMRLAGAAARETLISAAAQQWGLNETSTLKTKDAHVIAPNGKTISYVELANAAAQIEPPENPTLKPKSEWTVLGKSQARVDLVAKSTGTAQFGIDTQLPDMLYASIKVNPHLGSKMRSFNADKAKQMTGVEDIIELDNGVAVTASNTWYAIQAVNAIEFDWRDANYLKTINSIKNNIASSFDKKHQNSQLKDIGDVQEILGDASKDEIIEAQYFAPYLAHATMEPMNATAWLHDNKLEVWAGNQMPTQLKKEAIKISGLEADNVIIHTPLMGGGFGRRLELDFAKQAIFIATQKAGRPVKLTWSREEDMTHDYYRPMAIARFSAVMGEKAPKAIDFKTASSSVNASQMGRIGIPVSGPDTSIVQAAWDQPYDVENYRVTGYKAQEMLPVSSWRSVGASQNAFFHESMMDELAQSKALDPMQMRLELISHGASHEVLKAVKDMSGWGGKLPEGHYQGLAFCLSFGVPVAQVVEIKMIENKVQLVRVYAAVDVGIALDPRNIEAQVMGGINFGLAAAISGEITIARGKVQQTNFHNFTSMRLNQSPDIEVKILENTERIRGIGEPGTPPAAPALANAIFAATGQRIRTLPLNKSIKFV